MKNKAKSFVAAMKIIQLNWLCKLLPFLLFIFLLDSKIIAQGSGIDNHPEFLGFVPGIHVDSLPAIRVTGKYQKLVKAVPFENDSLVYEGIPLKSVFLFFHNNFLHSIDVKTEGANTESLFILMEVLYGKAEQIDKIGVQFRWIGREYELFYDKNMIDGSGSFSFVSIEVNKNYKSWIEYQNAPK